MGNITKAAIFDYNEIEDKANERKAKREIANDYINNMKYGVYDKDGELLFKTQTKREAKETIEEFNEIDLEETGKEKKYFIRKLRN